VIWLPFALIKPDPAHVLVMLTPQSGKEWGGVKSLSVAVGDWDERVSAMNVVKQGMLAP
jgi:uncharacterized protein with von Willebrand factor type A (vWA) domain